MPSDETGQIQGSGEWNVLKGSSLAAIIAQLKSRTLIAGNGISIEETEGGAIISTTASAPAPPPGGGGSSCIEFTIYSIPFSTAGQGPWVVPIPQNVTITTNNLSWSLVSASGYTYAGGYVSGGVLMGLPATVTIYYTYDQPLLLRARCP